MFLPPGRTGPGTPGGGNARPAPRCAAPDAAPTLTLTAETKREAYRKTGKTVGFYQQKRYLPEIRAELPEYKHIHSQVLQNVIERVDLAFKGFFRRVKAGQKAGYPRFKGQGRYDSFTFPQAYVTGVKLQEGGKRVLLKVFP